MKTRKREIAKAGIFGTKESPVIVTEKDLKEIAETFPEIKSAPVIFGHYQRASSPRLGNVTSVAYDAKTKTLTAEIVEADTLADAVEAGYYPDVSISAKQRAKDGKMYLVHLAYLGQEAPAIKDLRDTVSDTLGIAASESEGAIDFPSPTEKQFYLSDTPPEKNFLDNKKNKDEAPADGGEGESANQSKEAFSMTEEEARQLREENERLKQEAQEKDLALSEAGKQQRAVYRQRLKSIMDEKGIPKAVQEKALSLSDSLESGKEIELSDAGTADGKRKVSPADCLIEIISSFTKPVETGVFNLSDGEAPPADAGRVNFAKI